MNSSVLDYFGELLIALMFILVTHLAEARECLEVSVRD